MQGTIGRLVGTALAFGMVASLVGAGPGQEKGTKSTTAQALKDVVQLTDDDVRFHSKDGRVVFVDPMSGPVAEGVKKASAGTPDLILITHPHGDHFQPDVLRAYVTLNPKVVIAGPQDVAAAAKKAGLKMKVVEAGQKYEMAGDRRLRVRLDATVWENAR